MDSLESKNGEDDGTGVDGGEAVTHRDDEDVLDTVLLGVVVGPEADDGAESQTEGVEDLVGSVEPDGGFQQHLHLRREHVDETLRGALESDPSEEEDGEDHVGEEGGEVDDLAGAGDALHEDEIDEDPGGYQTENVPVLQPADIV